MFVEQDACGFRWELEFHSGVGRRDKAIDIGCIGHVVMDAYGGVESVLSGIYELCVQIDERGQSGDSRVNSSSSGDCLYSVDSESGKSFDGFQAQ